MQQAEVDVSKSAQLLDNSAAIRKITTMHQVLCILNYSYVCSIIYVTFYEIFVLFLHSKLSLVIVFQY